MGMLGSQSRLSCASARRLMGRTHAGISMRGAPAALRCRGLSMKAGASGMHVQNLKQKAKATPKCQGSYWFVMVLPVASTRR